MNKLLLALLGTFFLLATSHADAQWETFGSLDIFIADSSSDPAATAEGSGWAYIPGLDWGWFAIRTETECWVWISGHWYYTRPDVTPYFYSSSREAWCYHSKGTPWLHDMDRSEWFDVLTPAAAAPPIVSTGDPLTSGLGFAGGGGSGGVSVGGEAGGGIIVTPGGGGDGNGQAEPGVLTAGAFDDTADGLASLGALADKVLEGSATAQWPTLQGDVDSAFVVTVLDANGDPVAGADLVVTPPGDAEGPVLDGGKSGRDGRAVFFPHREGLAAGDLKVTASRGETGVATVVASTDREVTIQLGNTYASPAVLKLGFLIDATGSMGDEMEFLKTEVDAIVAEIGTTHPEVAIELAYTVYRDQGDEYVTKNSDFQSDVASFRSALALEQANGGGDYPEAVDAGLAAALDLNWGEAGPARMLFWMADAPCHDDRADEVFDSLDNYRARGIALYPIGASGVDQKAEYLMRSASAMTDSEYLFLTDDSGVGNAHAEPSIPHYQVLLLKDQITRAIRSEIEGVQIEATNDQVIREVSNAP